MPYRQNVVGLEIIIKKKNSALEENSNDYEAVMYKNDGHVKERMPILRVLSWNS